MKKLMLLPFIIAIIGCSSNKEESVYPIALDNEWVYQVTITHTDPDTVMIMIGTQSQKITESTTLDNGTSVFAQQMILTYDIDTLMTIVDTSETYLQETDDYVLEYDTKADTVPDTVLALPLENGKSWNINADTKAVIVGQENVTVPEGVFNDCWKIAWITDTDTGYVYGASGIGAVKTVFVETKADTIEEFKAELEDHTIN